MKSIDLVIGIAAGILLAAYAANADINSAAQPADVPVNSPDPSIPYGERVAANDVSPSGESPKAEALRPFRRSFPMSKLVMFAAAALIAAGPAFAQSSSSGSMSSGSTSSGSMSSGSMSSGSMSSGTKMATTTKKKKKTAGAMSSGSMSSGSMSSGSMSSGQH